MNIFKRGDWVVPISFEEWYAFVLRNTYLDNNLGKYTEEDARLDYNSNFNGKPYQVLNVQNATQKNDVVKQLIGIDPLRPHPAYTSEIFRPVTPDELALAKLLFHDWRFRHD